MRNAVNNRIATSGTLALALLVWLALAAMPATASLTLSIDPQYQSLETGTGGSLSIMLDQAVDVRLIDLRVQFDPTLLQHVQGEAGELFTQLGTGIITEFTIEAPGVWRAYILTQDPAFHTSGIGELVTWQFSALSPGLSSIIGISAQLYDGDGLPIDDVSLIPGSVLVSDTQQIELWTAPDYQIISVGETGSVSILLTDELDVRSIEVWVEYDPTIITSVSGEPGELFQTQPCYLWEDFEVIEPGYWHGFAVIIGHDCFITTPGELMKWTFTGVAEGTSPITSVDVDLYGADGLPIDVVSMRSGSVRVLPEGSILLYTTPEEQTLTARYSPDMGEIGTISVELMEDLDIRSVELWVEFDPTIVEHRQGGPGALFKSLPCITWTDFGLLEPNLWHGYAVIIGHDCWTTGPGEVMVWEFEALFPGTSPIISINADLYAVDGLPLPNVYQSPAEIHVTHPLSRIDQPALRYARLQLHPNPFNPSVALDLPAGDGSTAVVSVLDVKGRLIRTLWRGAVGNDGIRLEWDGRNENGTDAPSGQYFFIMQEDGGRLLSTRGTLVR
jgi:FlgD Ig-like domain